MAPGLALSREGAQELTALQPPINPSSFPRLDPGSSVCLPSSGRRLGYSEHVDTSVPADQLRNVILLPGIPGTRLFTHPAVQQRGYVPSWRLVVLERPGIGLSDPAPEPYGYTDFIKDFREFCAVLGLERVSVIGFSAGTPFATAIACAPPAQTPPPPRPPPPPPKEGQQAAGGGPAPRSGSDPDSGPRAAVSDAASPLPSAAASLGPGGGGGEFEGGRGPAPHDATDGTGSGGGGAASGGAKREGDGCGDGAAPAPSSSSSATAAAVVVDGVALISAIGPPNIPNKRQGMAFIYQFAFWACERAPWMVGWVVRSEAAAFRRRPLHALRKGFAVYNGKADVAALKRPEVERMLLESALEMYGRHQENAVLRENLLFAGRPWDFDLADCRTPVAIWQGEQDRGCTAPMASYLAERMGSTARAKVVPEQGHMVYFDFWEEVVSWVNGLPPRE